MCYIQKTCESHTGERLLHFLLAWLGLGIALTIFEYTGFNPSLKLFITFPLFYAIASDFLDLSVYYGLRNIDDERIDKCLV